MKKSIKINQTKSTKQTPSIKKPTNKTPPIKTNPSKSTNQALTIKINQPKSTIKINESNGTNQNQPINKCSLSTHKSFSNSRENDS